MPSPVPGSPWRPSPRTLWRLSGLLLLAAMAVAACTRDGCREGSALCGGGLWLCSRAAQDLSEESRQREACGACPDGTVCNLLYEPAECRRRPGELGDRCGAWQRSRLPEHQFFCENELRCLPSEGPRVCAEPAGPGGRCSVDDHCRPGLVCSRDAAPWTCVDPSPPTTR